MFNLIVGARMYKGNLTESSIEPVLVSVYIPTFNRLALLKRAVESVLSQTYDNIELIIVDDGSTDGTYEYLDALPNIDSRVVVLKKEGARGAPSSRNLAIFSAKGQYITGLDDDDFFKKDHVQKLFDKYESSCSFVFSRHFNWKDIIFSPFFYITKKITFKQLVYFNIVGNQVFTETWKLQGVGGFDVNLKSAQDYDTWLRLIKIYGPAKGIYWNTYIFDLDHGMGRITDNIKNKLESYACIENKHGFEGFLYKDSFHLRKVSVGYKIDFLKVIRSSFNPYNLRHLMSFLKISISRVNMRRSRVRGGR